MSRFSINLTPSEGAFLRAIIQDVPFVTNQDMLGKMYGLKLIGLEVEIRLDGGYLREQSRVHVTQAGMAALEGAKVPPHYTTGDRVRYIKDKIEDVPKGTEGTVVGCTEPDGRTVIVNFDFAAGNRYMPRSHIKPAPLPASPAPCQDSGKD